MKKLANDPNFVVKFALGEPNSSLVKQPREAGIHLNNVFFNQPKQYVLKSAHMSREDLRIFDAETGRMVMVSHHPGKNPYDMLDPLGTTNQDMRYNVAGGEWESIYDVTGSHPFQSFKIRPKMLSRHGRQLIKQGDRVALNVGKMGKLKTMSLRGHFMAGKGEDDELVYKCVADMMGRSVGIYNDKEELVAQMAKTSKAIILTAALGSGSESTIDIAAGVDCSTILAIIYGIQQVGQHCTSHLIPFPISHYNPIRRPFFIF